jgi:hypothetical protein
MVSGANSGVTGIDAGGQHVENATYLYEICYKCHSDQNVIENPAVTREWNAVSTRAHFDPANLSIHPVVAQGSSQNVPSLLPPYDNPSNRVITCTDCHGSDSQSGPRGPHGSLNNHLLKSHYETQDNTAESASAYALCYTCHSRTKILDNSGFQEHSRHIVDQQASCAVCHDPHGSRARPRLINFALSSVGQNGQGRLDMEIVGGVVQCFLTCHGKDHGGP